MFSEPKRWLGKCYGDPSPSKKTICRYFDDSKRDRTSNDVAESSGHVNLTVVPKNIEKINKMAFIDRILNLCEIADTLNITESSIVQMLHEHLPKLKVSSKWLPHLLTIDQKQRSVDDSEHCLELFKRNEGKFFMRYVTMDST